MEYRERMRAEREWKKAQPGSGWLLLLLTAISAATLIFILAQVKTMASGGLGGLSDGLSMETLSETQSRNGDGSVYATGENTNSSLPLICVDAGHGYDDPGAVNGNLNGLDEKDINLDIALRVAEALQEMGNPVLMTRDSDEIPADMKMDGRGLYVLDPYERCDIANEAEVDLFISIHCNSLPSDNSKRGTQLYYTAGHTQDNEDYAETMADSLMAVLGDRPQVIANPENDSYVVNRLVNAPSVLVETGFITNAADAKLMLSEDWRQQMAEALVEGICEFLRAGQFG